MQAKPSGPMPAVVLAILAVLAALLMLWQWLAARAFPLDPAESHGPAATSASAAASLPVAAASWEPSVTLLKPVKGADPGTAEALATWMEQLPADRLQVVFGVDSIEDPAVPLIHDLLARHPGADARLVICPERLGINRKVSNLIQMVRAARGEVIALSDADVAARPGLLGALAAPLADPAIGLVHCLYRMADAPTAAMRWEAFAVNADFWSQVLQNRTLHPLDYALGAAIAVRRADLEAIGGFESLRDHLADDNRLGRLIVQRGLRTELCRWVVDCRAGTADWAEVWRHQLRWAVTIRACQGLPYFLSILANGTFWPLLWMAITPSRLALTVGPVLILFRIIQGLGLESRFTGRPVRWTDAWVVPFKDLLQVVLWAAAFLQRHVVWRGIRYRVLADGRLEPAS